MSKILNEIDAAEKMVSKIGDIELEKKEKMTPFKFTNKMIEFEGNDECVLFYDYEDRELVDKYMNMSIRDLAPLGINQKD